MAHDELYEIFRRCSEELFVAHGVAPVALGLPSDDEPLRIRTAAIIGYSGPEVRGTVMLAVSREGLAATRPIGDDDRDWLAELCNQLLGRVKNRLFRHGVQISMSTPLVIRGERLAPSMKGEHAPYRWAVAQGIAYAWFDLECVPAFVWNPASSDSGVLDEGDALLF